MLHMNLSEESAYAAAQCRESKPKHSGGIGKLPYWRRATAGGSNKHGKGNC